MKTINTVLFAAILAGLFQSASAAPWIYRGSLSDGGEEANGAYDLRVTLIGANGAVLAQPVTLNSVQVQKGSFQTNVDFGVDVARFPGAKIKTEVQQGGSGFVQLGEPKAVNAPDGGPGHCWEVGGNTTVGTAVFGTNDSASDDLMRLTVRGERKLYLRAGGGVETINSLATGLNSMALGSATTEAAGSFAAGGGRTSAAATSSFVFSDSLVPNTPGALGFAESPGQFLVKAGGGIGFNTPAGVFDLAIGPRPGGDQDASIALNDGNGFGTLITTDSAASNMTLKAFREGSKIVTDAPLGLNVLNGITLGSALNLGGTVFVTIRESNNNLILNAPPLGVGPPGKIGLNRAPTANSVEVGGNASKDTAGSWLANSDARIKTEIQSIPNALDRLSALRPVTFKYNAEYLAAHPSIKDVTYYNVIAQEFQKVFPDAVQGSGEYLAGKANSKANEILQVDTYPAQIVAIAAIQELNVKLEIERKENDALKARLDALEARLK